MGFCLLLLDTGLSWDGGRWEVSYLWRCRVMLLNRLEVSPVQWRSVWWCFYRFPAWLWASFSFYFRPMKVLPCSRVLSFFDVSGPSPLFFSLRIQHPGDYSGIPKKGFPALYTKQPTKPYMNMCWGGSSTVTPKKNDRERTKENKCRQWRINKNEEASRSQRPPGSSTRLQDFEAAAPINTSKKDRDDDDAAAKGFPRYTTRREEG